MEKPRIGDVAKDANGNLWMVNGGDANGPSITLMPLDNNEFGIFPYTAQRDDNGYFLSLPPRGLDNDQLTFTGVNVCELCTGLDNGSLIVKDVSLNAEAEEQKIYAKASRMDRLKDWTLERYIEAVNAQGDREAAIFEHASNLFFIETGMFPTSSPQAYIRYVKDLNRTVKK